MNVHKRREKRNRRKSPKPEKTVVKPEKTVVQPKVNFGVAFRIGQFMHKLRRGSKDVSSNDQKPIIEDVKIQVDEVENENNQKVRWNMHAHSTDDKGKDFFLSYCYSQF